MQRMVKLLIGLSVVHSMIIPTSAFAVATAAQIVNVGPTAVSIGYVNSTGNEVLNATIGRWDTPYPNGDSGAAAPGLEPTGRSQLAMTIDVHDGGLVDFRYNLLTWDGGIWDWLDIWLETPTGTIPIVQRLGKPGNTYGAYWDSSNIGVSQSLNQWRDQQVRFVFSVMQDGWGDQSAANVTSFSVATCPVAPLTPLTDPVALSFEQGNTLDTNDLNAAASTGLQCMQQAVQTAGGTIVAPRANVT